jgi:hypothetical protein
MEFNTILYENEFQNPQIFQQTISLFQEQSTLAITCTTLNIPLITKESVMSNVTRPGIDSGGIRKLIDAAITIPVTGKK